MIKILGKMFESNPEKSTIVIKGKCSDCGCKTTIEITPSSGGFGLQGGALFKCSSDGYLVKCPDCYHVNPEISSLKGPNKGLIYQLHKVT
jgi:ribosomal protein S27E